MSADPPPFDADNVRIAPSGPFVDVSGGGGPTGPTGPTGPFDDNDSRFQSCFLRARRVPASALVQAAPALPGGPFP